MMTAARSSAYFALLFLIGCGGADDAGSNASASADNGSAVEASSAAAESAPAAPAPAAEQVHILAADGIEPGLRFGMKQADAIAAAAAAFGPAGKTEHNDECGEGPMDFVSFGGLQLGFQEGKLAGWSLDGTKPALRTASGLAIGSPRSALGSLEIDEESTLGPEFDEKGVGGLLDEKGEKVLTLWAGFPCQFR
ncbi:MAG TPA: hypothetical protein VIT45_02045 [Allosphingosinicella sp.]